MILKVLLIVFTGILALVALGVTIGGLVKKKKGLWIGSLIGFVVCCMCFAWTVAWTVKSSVEYIATDEFQEKTKKSAEAMGKAWGNTVSSTAKGLEETLDEEALLKLAGTTTRIVGKGVKVVAKNIDETFGSVTVFTDESIDNSGIQLGRAQRIKDSANYSFGLYLEFAKDFDGELQLTAFDTDGNKRDRTTMQLTANAGDNKVQVFTFEYFKPGMNGYCILSEVE
ncbi:MAG: hypothetical protein MI922_01140 [Bacteroidales bacterium]|nr:hypothetical protein [Bacteroidales bacterium]